MDIEIERLEVNLGSEISASRASAIGGLIGAALESTLRAQAAELSVAPAGYRLSSVAVPRIRVRSGASDDEIAQVVADALSRLILIELEVRP